MRASWVWWVAGLMFPLGCTSRDAWSHDESERIAEVMRKTPLTLDEAHGLPTIASPPLASGPIQSPGFTLDSPGPERRPRPGKRAPPASSKKR